MPGQREGQPFRSKRADLLILDADALADIHYLRKLSPVMRDGRAIDRAMLPQQKVLSR